MAKKIVPQLLEINGQRRQLLVAGSGAVAASLFPITARAQAWPSKPIRIIAAQAPGSSNDATARAFAEYFSTKLGVPLWSKTSPVVWA